MRQALALFCLLFVATVAWSQTPVGNEFQVNTYTSYNQADSTVAMDPDGGFVVVWVSGGYGRRINKPSEDKAIIGPRAPGQDGDGSGVFGQRFDNIGNPLGNEFQVNTYTTGNQRNPTVNGDADGNFVVVWDSYGYPPQDGSSTGVFGQRYASDGSAMGDEFQINTYTTYSQGWPSVAMDAGGDFVVVWQSSDGYGSGIFGQRFASDGSPLGGEFLANASTMNSQYQASVAMDMDGDFVVAWQSWDGYGSGVFAGLFGSDGSPTTGDFLVNTYTTNSQWAPSVAMDAEGNFVVAWEKASAYIFKNGIGGIEGEVHAQRFAGNGSRLGEEFQVNSHTPGYQVRPSVAMSTEGEFVVAWESGQYFGATQDGSYAGIFAQQFNSDGTARGDEFQANTFTLGWQAAPAVAMDADGDFVVSWNHPFQDGSNQAVLAQLFTPVEGPLALRTNGDSFSTGDTIKIAANVINDGVPSTYDIFFGVLWPDGNTVTYWADLGVTVGTGSALDVSSWVPYASNVDFTTPFVLNDPSFFTHDVTGLEVPGTYKLFLAAVVPGGLADGTIDPADVYSFSMVTITLNSP